MHFDILDQCGPALEAAERDQLLQELYSLRSNGQENTEKAKEIRTRLYLGVARLAYSIGLRLMRRGSCFTEDHLMEALVGLGTSLDSYNPSKSQYTTWLFFHVKDYLNRYNDAERAFYQEKAALQEYIETHQEESMEPNAEQETDILLLLDTIESAKLNDIESSLLLGLVRGIGCQETGREINVSPRRVRYYAQSLKRKVQAYQNREQLLKKYENTLSEL